VLSPEQQIEIEWKSKALNNLSVISDQTLNEGNSFLDSAFMGETVTVLWFGAHLEHGDWDVRSFRSQEMIITSTMIIGSYAEKDVINDLSCYPSSIQTSNKQAFSCDVGSNRWADSHTGRPGFRCGVSAFTSSLYHSK
jgi:hypothetical protein